VAKMGARPGSTGTPADLVLGSWRRTLVAASIILLAFAGLIAAATTFGDLRHANFPGHPYPPSGFYRNPFSGPDDLVNSAEASRVKADLLTDGQIEIRALLSGDASTLAQSTTGNALVALRKIIDDNNARGLYERDASRVDSIIVGRLQDPADPRAMWCVEEHGSGSVTYLTKLGGQVQLVQNVTFSNKFWLVKVGQRYLITDVEVRTGRGH
jgi:hypothetical protein